MTEFIIYTENQFQVKIIRAWTDNKTGEFKNQKWNKIMIQNSIQHEPSSPYIKDWNGVAE